MQADHQWHKTPVIAPPSYSDPCSPLSSHSAVQPEWVRILNGKSTQLGYTVPFTLVHAGKYRTEDKSKTDTLQKLNTTQKSKQHKKTAKQNCRGLAALYNTQPWIEVGLFYNVPSPHGTDVGQTDRPTYGQTDRMQLIATRAA